MKKTLKVVLPGKLHRLLPQEKTEPILCCAFLPGSTGIKLPQHSPQLQGTRSSACQLLRRNKVVFSKKLKWSPWVGCQKAVIYKKVKPVLTDTLNWS